MELPQKNHASLRTRLANAWRGLAFFFLKETGYKIVIPVIILGSFSVWLTDPTSTEFLILLLAFGIGILLGMFNLIVEELCDLYSTEYNPRIKIIKDVAAGACVFYGLITLALFILIAL